MPGRRDGCRRRHFGLEKRLYLHATSVVVEVQSRQHCDRDEQRDNGNDEAVVPGARGGFLRWSRCRRLSARMYVIRSRALRRCGKAIGDSYVRTGSELFLRPASHLPRAVRASPPVIPSDVLPLQHAMLALQAFGQLVFHFINSVPFFRIELRVLFTLQVEHVFVHAILLVGRGVIAYSEFEVSHVAGGELHLNGDDVVRRVLADDDALAEPAAQLVGARLGGVPGVAADAALAAVPVPLPGEAAAVQLVVVVVVRRVKAEPPRGSARRRLDQPAVAVHASLHQ